MKGAAVTMLCLVDRRSSRATVVEWAGSASPADAAAPAPIVVPLAAAPAAVVVAQEPGEPASIGTYSVRLYRDLSAGDYTDGLIRPRDGELRQAELRSKEHTSELQSLMRISYAVFCLKKTKTETNYKHNKTNV